MCIALDQDRLVSALEAMTGFAMPAVEMLGIAGVQPLHPSGEIGIGSSHNEVVVGRQQDKGVARPVMSKDDLIEQVQEAASVDVIAVDRLAGHAARGDVIHGAGCLETVRAGHVTKLGREQSRASSGASLVTKSLRF